ncbi:MAG: phage major capsid protein [Candidatus Acidiferrales bacterium]|jgi:HK97 family phage major capsid protein
MSTLEQTFSRNRAIEADLFEMNSITKKPRMTREDRARFDFLSVRVSALKAGYSPEEVAEQQVNSRLVREGQKPINFKRERAGQLTLEERLFRAYLNGNEEEQRDLITNNPQLSAINTTGGSFVPLEFWEQVTEAMAQVDPLTDGDYVNLHPGIGLGLRPLQLPAWDLTTIESEQVAESDDAPSSDFIVPTTTAKLLGGFMHRINLVASFEFDQDSFRPTMELLARAYGVGFARGIGKQLVNGTGTDEPQGIAVKAANSGVSNSTPGSLVLDDFLNIFFSINRIYRASPKCCWVCGDSVYKLIRKATDRIQNRPLLSVERDEEVLLGKPVLISPSLDVNPTFNPSLAQNQLIFGDLSHFHVRLSELVINRSIEGVGLIEKGLALYQGLMRADSWLADPSVGDMPPIIYATIS